MAAYSWVSVICGLSASENQRSAPVPIVLSTMGVPYLSLYIRKSQYVMLFSFIWSIYAEIMVFRLNCASKRLKAELFWTLWESLAGIFVPPNVIVCL